MKTITVTELRGDIYNLFDNILSTGVPLEIKKGGQKLRITPVEPVDKFANLVYQPNLMILLQYLTICSKPSIQVKVRCEWLQGYYMTTNCKA